MLHLWALTQLITLPARRARLANRKAAGLLEYALVALISVAVFGVMYLAFKGFATDLFDNIKSAITGKNG